MAKTDKDIVEKQAKTVENFDPNDEFPISSDVYCKLKRLDDLKTRIFLKAMMVENRYKKCFIKEWDKKFFEFYSRTA